MKKSFFISAALTAAIALSAIDAGAADYRTNPFTLTYEGAITENVAGKVNIHTVTYTLGGLEISANLYTPPDYDPNGSYPAVVVAHPNGGVKEQVAGLYAQRLAEQGYITIAADAAYQGASGGQPRSVDKPEHRIEDIHGMADFLTKYPGVDASRLGLLGICGGGGYALHAAQTDKRFKAIATLSMFNSGRVRRNGFLDSELSTIQKRLKQASDARAQEAAGGEVIYAADGQLTDEQIAALPFELYREGFTYYGQTHAHPNSTFRYTMSSLLSLMRFDAASHMDLIDQPLLMIAGSNADTLYMTHDAFGKATGTEKGELFLIKGATHIQTYWKPEYVDQAINKLVGFYGEFLADRAASSKPLVIQEQGSFAVGGTVVTAPGEFDPIKQGVFNPAALDSSGQTLHGDHAHVLYQVPVDARSLPMVMWHGYGQSGKTWETTPDGREGFQTIFLRRKFPVYLIDQPRRGRAARSTEPIQISAAPDDQQWFGIFRMGEWPEFYEGVQVAKDKESLNQFFRQMVPDTGPINMQINASAVSALFDRIGPGILVTHSHSGGMGWRTAIKNRDIRAIVSFEPGSGFVFPENEVPDPVKYVGGSTAGAAIPLSDFKALTRFPILIYYGDFIPNEPSTNPGQDQWRANLAMARQWKDAVNRHGGDVTLVHLPEIGLRGNTHFPMSDLNNLQVADHMAAFLEKKDLTK